MWTGAGDPRPRSYRAGTGPELALGFSCFPPVTLPEAVVPEDTVLLTPRSHVQGESLPPCPHLWDLFSLPGPLSELLTAS